MEFLHQRFAANDNCCIAGNYEILATMKEREDKFYKFESFVTNEKGTFSKFDGGMLPEKWRRELCEWIASSVAAFDVEDLEVAFGRVDASSSLTSLSSIASYAEELAFSFMDRFLATLPVTTRRKGKACHVVALVSTHLAYSLISGSRYMSLPFTTLLTLLDHEGCSSKITSEELEATHCAMLRALRFKLHPPMTNEYLVLFRALLQNFVDSRNTGDYFYRCLQPSQCDFLIEQAHFMSELALKESCFVAVPKHTIAFVALGVMMEYTFPTPSSKEAQLCQAFLRHVGTEMNLKIIDSYLDGASHWKTNFKTTDKKKSVLESIETGRVHPTTETKHRVEAADLHDIRIVRTLLWKLVLDQPSIASNIQSASFGEASQLPQWTKNFDENKARGYPCPSPHSVANFPPAEGGEVADCPVDEEDGTVAAKSFVMKKAPIPKFHDLELKHLLWWECHIESCKGLVNQNYIPHGGMTNSNYSNDRHVKDKEMDLPADLYAPDFRTIESIEKLDCVSCPGKSEGEEGGKLSFLSPSGPSSLAPRRRTATSDNVTSGQKRRMNVDVDQQRYVRRSVSSITKVASSVTVRQERAEDPASASTINQKISKRAKAA